MAMPLLRESPLVPAAEVGPLRRRDYFRRPDEPRCELIYGRLFVSPSPSPLHQILVGLLWQSLHRIAGTTGGLALLAPLDVVLAEHSVVQPDVIYLSAEHRGMVRERVEGAPDLLVEVLSPGSARRDRGEKTALYAEAGVGEYWIVDPAERQIEFLVHDSGRFTVHIPRGRYRSPLLPEVELDLADLWAELDRLLPSA